MSSELNKYIKDALERKNENFFNAEVIDFPNDKIINDNKNLELKTQYFWRIGDVSNEDQYRAIKGICFMVGALVIMGLYSNFF
mgnify:CR=1 FL=1